ncbi:MAG: L,D-transpeptidase [Clostridiales Family XIII bacterium]|jgi:lipoprotein-anchoring transpeptidase ErfK/SrfK|nr:L,D-transpeptidase [Clostridiales Family XIII bacterium]
MNIKQIFSTKRRIVVFLVIFLFILALIITSLFLNNYYKNKLLPNTYFLGEKVSKKLLNLESLNEKIFLTLDLNNTKKTISLSALSMKIDEKKTKDDLFLNNKNFINRIFPFKKQTVYPSITVSTKSFEKKIKSFFKEKIKKVREPKIFFTNQEVYDFKKGRTGVAVDYEDLENKIEAVKLVSYKTNIKIKTIETLPKFSDESAKTATIKANTFLKPKIHISREKSPQDALTLSKSIISNFIKIKKNSEKAIFTVEVVEEYINNYTAERLPEILSIEEVAPTNKIVVKLKEKNKIIQNGIKGKGISNISEIEEKIFVGITNIIDENIEVKEEEIPYKISKITSESGKWIEVDLTSQKTYLWDGIKKLKTYTISSGLKSTPTVTGDFKIYKKLDHHTMRGYDIVKKENYVVPDVRYAAYFTGAYAFHAAPWHNNFGQPMSHGCVNMKMNDAKYLYDWAKIGTRVIVYGSFY